MSKQALKDKVLFILCTDPEARNSDVRLTIELWKHYYPDYILEGNLIRLEDLFDIPRQDDIRRIRAVIQNVERLYLPTNIAVFIERARQSDEWREFLGYRVNKLPDVMTEADFKKAIEDYLSTPNQTSLL